MIIQETPSSPEISLFLKLLPLICLIISATVGLLMWYLNVWWAKRTKIKDEISAKQKLDDEKHTSLTSKWLDLSAEEREQLRIDTKALHDREIRFLQDQIKTINVELISLRQSELATRMKNHRIANHVNKLQMYVQIIHSLAQKFHIDLPQFKFDKDHLMILDDVEERRLLTEARGVLKRDIDKIDDVNYEDGDIIT